MQILTTIPPTPGQTAFGFKKIPEEEQAADCHLHARLAPADLSWSCFKETAGRRLGSLSRLTEFQHVHQGNQRNILVAKTSSIKWSQGGPSTSTLLQKWSAKPGFFSEVRPVPKQTSAKPPEDQAVFRLTRDIEKLLGVPARFSWRAALLDVEGVAIALSKV